MKVLITLAVTLVALVLGGLLYIYSGFYEMGADAPHWRATHGLVTLLRDRSIAVHSANLQVPDLEDSALILKGAGHYAAMCVGCHLAPGIEKSEIRPGLYPRPPNLAQVHIAPTVAFWAIKHGIKMSAMPAWGASHDDPTIWSMVAFLQKLPDMSPAQYKEIVARAPPDEDMDMDEAGEHGHDNADGDAHDGANPKDAEVTEGSHIGGPALGVGPNSRPAPVPKPHR
jgi:mono/diheme cytochrome c family protein